MLANLFSWWLARITELLPRAWTNAGSRPRDGIIIDADPYDNLVVATRHDGQLSPLSLGAAARQAGRTIVLVRPPAGAVLIKHHTVPTAPRRQLDQLLRYELARITPFAAEDLFWHWQGHAKPGNAARTDVTLTMVPRAAVAAALAALNDAGLQADFVEVATTGPPRLLPVRDATERSARTTMIRVLTAGCAALAAIALVLPLGLQAVDLHATNTAIQDLQPAITQVNDLRQGIAAGDAGRDVLTKETERTGDVLEILATITRILPDDTYLTDFSLRERQITLSGRSASAPRLITGLSADPAIRNTAFAAPVTRIEGASSDVFSIKAEVATNGR